MLSKRSISALNLSERQILRYRWMHNGQCVRCFHASLRSRADQDSKGNDEGTPYNAPKRGPTRQQRAAMISEEVKMVQRDHPSPGFGESNPSTLRPAGAGETVDPENIGIDVGDGRMGEPSSAPREGPEAQGVARVADEDEIADTSKMARGARSPHDDVQDPSKGGASVLDTTGEARSRESLSRPPEEDEDEDEMEEEEEEEEDVDDHDKTWTQQSSQEVQPVAETTSFTPDALYRDDLLRRHGTSTLLAGNSESTIEEQIRIIAEPGQAENNRHIPTLARKLISGKLVRFESREEKAAVEEEAKRISRTRVEKSAKQSKQSEDDVKPAPKQYVLDPALNVQRRMCETMVEGRYDTQKFLREGKENFSQPVLNEVATMLLKNGSYLRDDRRRMSQKIQSLLPASRTASSPKQEGSRASAK